MSTSGRGQVLIPWPNRIQDGSYEYDGRRHQLPLDDVEEQDAIHGLVCWSAWTVGERTADRLFVNCGSVGKRSPCLAPVATGSM